MIFRSPRPFVRASTSPISPALGRLAALLLILTSQVACLSAQREADQLYADGRCNEALPLYETAFAEGRKNAETYHHAARCALQLGEFSTAERYYSQALRHGGGIEVASELADFYVKTSNYTSAVRVFQYLLYQVEDKQSVYNNLGTALMYADQPFDAESYLLVAQQLEPQAPSTYLNLGVLYDRHLKQPWLAINFYECYAAMAGHAENNAMVRQRAAELKQRWVKLYEPGAVDCGKVYEPALARPVADLRAEFPNTEESEPIQIVEDPGPMAEGERKPVSIEPMIGVDEMPPEAQEKPATTPGEDDLLALGKMAYDAGNWAQAIAHLSEAPFSKLGLAQYEMLGLSYLRQNNWSRGKHWLELAVEGDPKPETVEALAAAHRAAGDESRVLSICKKYGNLPEYEKMRERFCTGRKPTNSADDE